VATYTVNTHEVAGVAQQVTSGSAEIENQLHRLMGQIRSLHGNWEGSASAALQELYTRWNAQAEALKETLREIGDQMRQAAAEYEANEAANTSRFRV
jgi:WXG100 family type VII secretion target